MRALTVGALVTQRQPQRRCLLLAADCSSGLRPIVGMRARVHRGGRVGFFYRGCLRLSKILHAELPRWVRTWFIVVAVTRYPWMIVLCKHQSTPQLHL